MSRIKITRMDSPTRFFATSKTDKGKIYVVDLGRWICTCKHQTCRLHPAHRDGKITKRKAACIHMKEALLQIALGMVEILLEHEIAMAEEAKQSKVIGGLRIE